SIKLLSKERLRALFLFRFPHRRNYPIFPSATKKCGSNHVSVLFLNPYINGKGKVCTPEYLDILTL
ncbi:TPA: hypothetical protein ACMEXS_004387, partial [Klebsiella variicola subsp. variicola]